MADVGRLCLSLEEEDLITVEAGFLPFNPAASTVDMSGSITPSRRHVGFWPHRSRGGRAGCSGRGLGRVESREPENL